MTTPHNPPNPGPPRPNLDEIRRSYEARKPAEALRLLDGLPASAQPNVDALELRFVCLMDVGQFEKAIRVAEDILRCEPGRPGIREKVVMLEAAMARPAYGGSALDQRPFASEIPRSFLLRMQQAVHHYRYRGVQMVKDPFDLALYPMLLWALRPGTIIEIGSKAGGSGMWFGDLLKNMGIPGHVHSFDVVPVTGVSHENVTFYEGDGRNLGRTMTPELLAGFRRPWLVIEDADHTYETSMAVLEFFHSRLQADEYIVVEDGIISDLYPDSFPDYSSGPHRALREFLGRHGQDYIIDANYCDFFGYNATWSSNGFLKKLT